MWQNILLAALLVMALLTPGHAVTEKTGVDSNVLHAAASPSSPFAHSAAATVADVRTFLRNVADLTHQRLLIETNKHTSHTSITSPPYDPSEVADVMW